MKSSISYSELLKEYREKELITQKELANILGVSFASVNRWENSHFDPTMKVKRKLKELFIKSNIIKGE